ncbi:spore germination protein KB [Paenibacillus sp. UNC496MF]|uniref:GerAB/ArcD/ProY family transporter n=1 Tax=Paenibacillus sp. UNC496MF TaxID=1502753 RepID=UPI0008EAD1F7|nr:endospore germination permease [Paenibacillus sp. UNC496MF]SFI86628.1 spore germination protein KB [Paenibacillus sp. UNC496MF]
MEQARLSAWQMFLVTFYFTTGTTWIVLTGPVIGDAKQYAWLVCLGALAYGILLALLWLYLSSRYPGKSLVEIAVAALGRWAGGVIALFYVLYFVQIASWVTRNLGDFLHTNMMPQTPVAFFSIMVLFTCAYAVVKGIASIAMVSELLTPYLHLAYWVPILVALRQWDWQNFHESHIGSFAAAIARTNYAFAFPFMETVALMMLFPYVQKRLNTSYILGIAASGLSLALSVLANIGILGVNRGSRLIYPVFMLFREMQFASFLEHLETFLAINVLFIVCLKLSILFYCALLAICQLFRVKRREVVAFPLIWILSAYSLLFHNVIENMEWVQKYLFTYYLLYAVVFPLLLLAAAWLRKAGAPGAMLTPRTE